MLSSMCSFDLWTNMYSYLVHTGVHVQYTKMHTITLSVCTSTEQKIKFPIFPVARNLTFPPPILQRIEENTYPTFSSIFYRISEQWIQNSTKSTNRGI